MIKGGLNTAMTGGKVHQDSDFKPWWINTGK